MYSYHLAAMYLLPSKRLHRSSDAKNNIFSVRTLDGIGVFLIWCIFRLNHKKETKVTSTTNHAIEENTHSDATYLDAGYFSTVQYLIPSEITSSNLRDTSKRTTMTFNTNNGGGVGATSGQRGGAGQGKKQLPFVYDVNLLSKCAITTVESKEKATAAPEASLSKPSNSTSSSLSSANDDVGSCCWTLFVQYSKHYGRPVTLSSSTNEEELTTSAVEDLLNRNIELRQRYIRFIDSVQLVYTHNHNIYHGGDDTSGGLPTNTYYQITLNQFSDGTNHPYSLSSTKSSSRRISVEDDLFLKLWDDDNFFQHAVVVDDEYEYDEEYSPAAASTTMGSSTDTDMMNLNIRRGDLGGEQQRRRGLLVGNVEFIPLANVGNILWASGHHRHHHHHNKNKKIDYKDYDDDDRIVDDDPPVVRFPPPPPSSTRDGADITTTVQQDPFSIPFMLDDQTTEGVEVYLKGAKKEKKKKKKKTKKNHNTKTKTKKKSETQQVNDATAATVDPFARSLNWATSNNPDGVPLVHSVFDQGTCGSCWAYAATGSLETSAARNSASTAYHEYIRDNRETRRRRRRHNRPMQNNATTTSLESAAYQHAQQVELEAFQMVNLSVQQLIDCDIASGGDQGCVGGNPLLAFYYLHEYGLATWEEYPYVGRAGGSHNSSDKASGFQCRSDLVSRPMATVSSWGVLPSNREDLIELALRYIGPVAVGTNGDDAAFMAYSGGIFNKPNCGQGRSNHAMLIVGYGEEEIGDPVPLPNSDVDGAETPSGPPKVVRYWITRNSWGTNWGENGYIRIQRGNKKRSPGVCGIAANPSVALGGTILYDRKPPVRSDPNSMVGRNGRGSSSSESESDLNGYGSNVCDTLWDGPWQNGCNRLAGFFDNHKALSLGILGVFAALVLAVYPLSFACRRHKRRRRPVSPNQGFRLDDPGNSYDRDAGVSYDSVGVSEGGSFIESKNEMGNGSHYSREDETGTGLASHEMPVSESTPLMKYKGSNKFRATKLSEVAIARRQEAQERYRGSELVIKTT